MQISPNGDQIAAQALQISLNGNQIPLRALQIASNRDQIPLQALQIRPNPAALPVLEPSCGTPLAECFWPSTLSKMAATAVEPLCTFIMLPMNATADVYRRVQSSIYIYKELIVQTSISVPVDPVSNLPPESLCVCEPVSLLTRCKLRVASKFHEFRVASKFQEFQSSSG